MFVLCLLLGDLMENAVQATNNAKVGYFAIPWRHPKLPPEPFSAGLGVARSAASTKDHRE